MKSYRAWLAAAIAILFYALCGFWIWQRRELLQESFHFPLSVLWLPLGFALLIVMLNPWRHQWLLHPFAEPLSFKQALYDRLVMKALKTFMPWVLGDPYGYLIVGRRLKLELKQLAPVWVLDKWLTLAAVGVYALGASLWLVCPPVLAVCSSLALLALVAVAGLPGLRAYPVSLRWRLTLLAVVQEGLHLAGYVALLAAVLDGGVAAVRGYDVVLVHLAGTLPTLLGGAGTREAATLLIFSGMADDRALFLAAFTATLILRVLPSLPGVVLYRSWYRQR